MTWVEVSVPVRPEAVEAVAAHCLGLGSPGVHLDDGRVLAYFTEPGDRVLSGLAGRLAAVRAVFGPGAVGEPRSRPLPEEDWREGWKRHYRPISVGRRLHIAPVWLRDRHRVPTGRLPIWLEPGTGFGSGEHASTRIALILLEQALLRAGDRAREPGRRVTAIDLGTGSGVLAVAAALLARARVWACDHDRAAVAAARANVARNGVGGDVQVEPADVFQPDAASLPPFRADVVVANVLFGVLEKGLPVLLRWLRPGGRLVLAGVTAAQRAPLAAACEREGCSPVAVLTVDGWAGLLRVRGKKP